VEAYNPHVRKIIESGVARRRRELDGEDELLAKL
jgi:hypothetical protein